jgi:hypothetical protein
MTQKNNSRSSVTPTQSTILEQGDIFFFYRPKVRSEKVESIEDVRRFFMVLAPESKNLYRLLVIGKNHFLRSGKQKPGALKDTGQE